MGQRFPFTVFGGGRSGAGSAATDTSGRPSASGLKPGTSASLFNVTAGGGAVETVTVDAQGKASFTTVKQPGQSYVIDGTARLDAGPGQVVAPAAPTMTLTAGNGQVSIAWADGANGGSAITSHGLYRGTVSGNLQLVGFISTGSPYVDTGLTNGTPYIYQLSAKNGAGESVRTAEATVTPAAASTAVNLLIVAGQSNSQSLGTATTANGGPLASQVLPAGWTGPSANILIYDAASNTLAQYQPYVNSEQGANPGNTWGPEAAYVLRHVADNPGVPIVIIKHSIGSTGLAADASQQDWSPSTNELYLTLKNKVQAAKALLATAGKTIASNVMLWCQGEQDARDATKAGNYGTNLSNFKQTAQADFGFTRFLMMRLHIEQTNSGFTPGWLTVYNAQGTFATSAQDVEFVSTDGLATIGDSLHLTTSAVDTMGARFYDVSTRWWTKAPFAGLAAIADITGDRCAIPFVAGDLSTMKSCRLSDVLAVTTTATTARTYIDAFGFLRNDLAANTMRINYVGSRRELRMDGQQQNAAIYSHDLTQSATWVSSGINPLLDQTGMEFTSPTNAASSITATTANATILQTITAASALRFFSAYLKRITGTGAVQMTQDGGTTWTTVAVTGTWARFSVPGQTLTNPQVGFRLAVSGDAIAVQFCQSEVNLVTPAIKTVGTAVTRASENFGLSLAALALLQGSAGTLIVRATGPTQSAATFASGDTANETLMSRSAGGQLQATAGGVTLSATAGSGGLGGAFGGASGYSPAGRRLCLNGGAVASDTQAVTAHTAVQLMRAQSGSTASYPNCGIDFFAVGPSLLNDNQYQALAAANY